MTRRKPVKLTLCPAHSKSLKFPKCTRGFKDCEIARARTAKDGKPGPPRTIIIPDDIQQMNVSRQRKIQVAYVRMGLCSKCGEPLDVNGGSLCLAHKVQYRESQRVRLGYRKRYKGAKSYGSPDAL